MQHTYNWVKLQVYHATNDCRQRSINYAQGRKCWYDFTLFGTTVRFLHSKDLQELLLSAHKAKLLICLMGTYGFVDDECTFDLTHTERLVVLVKGDHIRRGHCFSKEKVLERTNGVKQWHGWRMQLQDRIKSG